MSQHQWELTEFDTHANNLKSVSSEVSTQLQAAQGITGMSNMYGVIGLIFEGALCKDEQSMAHLITGLRDAIDGCENGIRETRKLNADTEQTNADHAKEIDEAISNMPRP